MNEILTECHLVSIFIKVDQYITIYILINSNQNKFLKVAHENGSLSLDVR